MSDDSNFDPDELEEIAIAMDKLVEGAYNGYEVTIFISHNDAVDLIDEYNKACDGDESALNKCWDEYSKIMLGLATQIGERNEENK